MIKSYQILSLLLAVLVGTEKVQAFKAPFRPVDVLPILPRQISRPILNKLNNAADLLPSFVGAASVSNNSVLNWKGSCFYNNTAWLVFHNNSGTQFGGGTLHIKVSKAHSWTCMDLYVFATPYRVTWDYYILSREHTLDFKEWESQAEFEYVKNRGVSIFLMQAGMLGTLQAMWEVVPLFTNTKWGESANLAFLEKHMGATFEERPQPWITNITIEDIHSGDFLALSKIRGLWGGFETLEKWVTGSYAGHTAVCLRDSEGKLWVAESGHENEEGEDVIAILPWDEWWEYELKKDDTNPQIALLPLHPELRAVFNETAAWEYAKSMSGKPYGYHNLIFSWIDTVSGNYPPPLDAHLVASVMTVWTQMKPAYAGNIWNEALNKRLGTQNFSLSEILVEVEKRGSSFGELLAIPEQDDWIYVDGKSTSCVAFIFEMYKEAGLFGELATSIQVTEFTIKDAYSLKLFENNSTRLPEWCNNDADTVKLPFCQIKGKYRMELPGYNTMDPYPHMNERCPSMTPEYSRPVGC
ncbi:hypothetical protein ABFS82_13G170100 [Erythranthe guttata]|uniref:Inositol-1,4,5-trisphosphate 5-phosphatase 4 n=1 Tax=Erythranthe guttata TaxID=4155 RepID=A0A022PSB4_ERYGU|nr:PREDICTED: uncharacterized protein LOC105948816 [Erythranthe guttata]EYU19247.1 hypothetical protein MIMGU_mgv1a004499mg [Erythranthe guttata]|eukprot:XP_012827503.1 PREDICTED: uncharacterized protein LOC105948816 [Erythranthe guttata]